MGSGHIWAANIPRSHSGAQYDVAMLYTQLRQSCFEVLWTCLRRAALSGQVPDVDRLACGSGFAGQVFLMLTTWHAAVVKTRFMASDSWPPKQCRPTWLQRSMCKDALLPALHLLLRDASRVAVMLRDLQGACWVESEGHRSSFLALLTQSRLVESSAKTARSVLPWLR